MNKRNKPAPPQKVSIRELLADADDSALITGIVAVIKGGGDQPARKPLPEEHLHVWRTWDTVGLISCGGFRCLYEEGEFDVEERIASFEAIGAKEAAARLRQSASVFPDGQPHEDPDELDEYLEKLTWKG